MVIKDDFVKRASHASAKTDGVVLTAMVRRVSLSTPSVIPISSAVCQNDDACIGFPLAGQISPLDGDDKVANMTCYTGGKTVFNNHQMCDVTSQSLVSSMYKSSPNR